MATSEKPGESEPQRIQRVDLQRKVSLKFKELQGFITEYSENLSIGGMFIRTQTPPPPGTVFDFEFTLGEDYRLIHGIGEVVWVRAADGGFDRPAGMGVRFLSLDPDSEKLIDRIVAERLKKEGREGAAPSEIVPGEPWVERVLGQPERRADSEPGSEQLSIEGALPGPPGAASDDGPMSSPTPGVATGPETGDWGLLTGPLDLPEPGRAEPPAAEEPEESLPEAPEPVPLIPPSPMASSPYARSYRGAAVAGTPKKHRTFLAVVLGVLVLVAAAAVMVLFFPEASVRWLVGGGDSANTPVRVAAAPAGAAPATQEPAAPATQEPAAPATGAPPHQEPPPPPEHGSAPRFEPPADAVPPPVEASDAAPAETRPAPPPAPEPEPAARPAPEPAPAASFSRVLNVLWEPQGDELQVTVFLDGRVEEWQYSVTRLASPPRELVQIRGVRVPFARSELPVSSDLVRRIRIGFHPERRESELHVVVDLADRQVVLNRSEAVGQEIRLYFSRSDS